MRPSEVPTRDWNLYYNHTIMNHDTMGVIHVTVADGTIHGRKTEGDRYRQLEPDALTCLWPRACAINWGNRAMYIARRSRREARRSASLNHYYVAYGFRSGRQMDMNLLTYLCFPNEYPTLDFAYEAIMSKSRESIAISPELILAQGCDGCGVIYKADVAGMLTQVEERYTFIPNMDGSPAAKRATYRFQKEGILCQ